VWLTTEADDQSSLHCVIVSTAVCTLDLPLAPNNPLPVLGAKHKPVAGLEGIDWIQSSAAPCPIRPAAVVLPSRSAEGEAAETASDADGRRRPPSARQSCSDAPVELGSAAAECPGGVAASLRSCTPR